MKVLIKQSDSYRLIENVGIVSIEPLYIVFSFINETGIHENKRYLHKLGDNWRVAGIEIANRKLDTLIFNPENGEIDITLSDSASLIDALDGIKTTIETVCDRLRAIELGMPY